MPQTSEVEQALQDGARRSMMACSLPANDALPVRVWRRWRWGFVGAAMFLLLELLGLGSLASGIVH